jgi:hypothetical protein
MLVKVHNNNVHPYKEEFRGRMIEIPANDFIEMDEDEADYFLQAFVFPKKDSQGRPDPLYFKKLKIEKPKVDKPVDDLVCHANGQKAATAAELNQMIRGFSHMLAEKDDAGEAEALKKQNTALKKENKEMKTRLERIEEKLGLALELADEQSV